jgi:hypothetical protein
VKLQEITDTALAFGFTKYNVEEALKAVAKPNEELKIDDVLAYLNSNFVPTL